MEFQEGKSVGSKKYIPPAGKREDGLGTSEEQNSGWTGKTPKAVDVVVRQGHEWTARHWASQMRKRVRRWPPAICIQQRSLSPPRPPTWYHPEFLKPSRGLLLKANILFAALKKDSQKEYLHWKIMKMPWGEGTGWAGENSAYLVSAHRGDRPFDPQKHREISVRHWPEKSDISSTDFSFPSVCFESCPEGKLGFLRGTLLSWRTALRDNWFLITLETDDMKCSAFFCRLIKSLGGSQPGCRRGCTFCPSASAGCIVFVKIFFRAQKVKFLLVGTRVLLDAETQSIVNGSEQAST